MYRIVLLVCVVSSIAAGAPDARQALEAAAGEIRWLDPRWVIYDRDQPGVGPREAGASIRLIQEIMHSGYRDEELRPLLEHEDPKVRTLAVVALAYIDYPHQLNTIAARLADEGETFPAPRPIALTIRNEIPEDWPEDPQTVASVARSIIVHHLHSAGAGPGQSAPAEIVKEHWDRYWGQRKDQPYGLADFIVLWERATTSTIPLPAGREGRMWQVRQQIRQLPMPDRFIVLHAVGSGAFSGKDHVATDNELLTLARELDRPQRLALIRGESLVEDVDQSRRTGPWHFILRHAGELLEPEDAEMLLERERGARQRNRTWRTPMGTYAPDAAIAAAELRPDRAREILYAALGRFIDYNHGHRRQLGIALFRLGNDADLPYLVHLFYSMHPEQSSPGDRVLFLQGCREADPQRYYRMLTMIVYDLRFSGLGSYPLRELGHDVGRWSGREIIRDDEVRSLRPHAHEDEAGAQFQLLVQWRNRIRDVITRRPPIRLDWELDFESGL